MSESIVVSERIVIALTKSGLDLPTSQNRTLETDILI